jgi:hypothetical protein
MAEICHVSRTFRARLLRLGRDRLYTCRNHVNGIQIAMEINKAYSFMMILQGGMGYEKNITDTKPDQQTPDIPGPFHQHRVS